MTVNTPKSVTAVFLLLWDRKTQTQKFTYYRFINCNSQKNSQARYYHDICRNVKKKELAVSIR